jgi:hypothetical protein
MSGSTFCIREKSEIAVLVKILQSADVQECGLHGTTVAELGTQFKANQGSPWAKLCKQRLGPLPQFLQKYESIFTVDSSKNILLCDVPIRFTTDAEHEVQCALSASSVQKVEDEGDLSEIPERDSDEAIAKSLHEAINGPPPSTLLASQPATEDWQVVGKRRKSGKSGSVSQNTPGTEAANDDDKQEADNGGSDVQQQKLNNQRRKRLARYVRELVASQEFGR